MLKKILAIILATVLCFCFTACEEEENIYNENKSEGTVTKDATNGKNPKEEKINIYNTFKTAIETYKSESTYPTRYSLTDVDGNKIPELIYNVDSGKYKMYAYDGKTLIYSGSFKSKIGVYTYNGMLLAAASGEGYHAYAKISLDDKLKIHDIGYPYMTSVGFDASNMKYTIDQKEVTGQEYTAITDSMKEMETYPLSDLSPVESLLK